MSGWYRHLFPRGIAGQTTAILVIALVLSQALAGAVYMLLAPQWEMRLRPQLVAAKIVTVVRMIESLPTDQRAQAAAAASDKFASVSFVLQPNQTATAPVSKSDDNRFRQWIAKGTDKSSNEITVVPDAVDPSASTTRIEVPLRGGGAVVIRAYSSDAFRLATLQQLAALGFLFVTIGGVAIWLTQRVVAPLSLLARTAEQLGLKGEAPPLPEHGPLEVRRAARTFNLMQERLRRYLADRTSMLAAISHDLRTPLTRLRLRVETDATSDQRSKMLQDLATMEDMLTSTLAFIRDQEEAETAESVDLASLMQTICDEFADGGDEIRYVGLVHQAFYCRSQAMTRALSNLVANATKYGRSVVVRLCSEGDGQIVIDIEDDGPGIPDAEKQKVFEPFYRLDQARGTDSGGMGLGLAIARTIVLSHGGNIRLLDRQPHGLVVRVAFADGGTQQDVSNLDKPFTRSRDQARHATAGDPG